jgi:hypothetical protein
MFSPAICCEILPPGGVSALERELELVYALYGLTPEKIKIVEDTANTD